MSGSDPKPPPAPDEKPQDPKTRDLRPREKTSGRVAFDARGNAVWEWRMKTGVFGRDVDTGKLRTLEAKDLEIAADLETANPEEKKQDAVKAAKAGGFDPYNSSAPAPGPAAAPHRSAPAPEEKQDKPGFFRRLFGKG